MSKNTPPKGGSGYMTSKVRKSTERRKKHELWYKFLKLNTDYKKTCEAKGDGPLRDLYDDFGDIFSLPFAQWYEERYESLFKPDPESRFLFDHVGSEETFRNYFGDPAGSIVIVVNRRAPLSTLELEFPKFIRKLASFPSGRRAENWDNFDGSRYPLRQGPSARVLDDSHDIYVTWLEAEERKKAGGEKPDLAKIGHQVLAPNDREREKLIDREERHNYYVRAKKHLEQAKVLIVNATQNAFPVDRVVDSADYPSLQLMNTFITAAKEQLP